MAGKFELWFGCFGNGTTFCVDALMEKSGFSADSCPSSWWVAVNGKSNHNIL